MAKIARRTGNTAPSGDTALLPAVVRALVIGLSYYVAARLSLRLALVGESVTPLWPPTGIALVGFLFFGNRIWPGVAIAAFLVNAPISPTPAAAAGIAAGNTLAPLVAAGLLRSSGFRHEVDRFRDAVSLVFLGALASMTVSATAGTLSLLASDAIRSEEFASTWSVWWAGDAMGILSVAPFLLSIRSFRLRGAPPFTRAIEAIFLFGGLTAAAFAIVRTGRPVWVVVFPLLGWAAWRFQQRGAAPAALIVILIATWAAAHDQGPFAGTGLLEKMGMLQLFNAAVSFTSFFFAAIVAERERSESDRRLSIERERQAQARLYEREHRIADTLQRSLLPEQLPDLPDVRAVARYVPAVGDVDIGGDWYDMIPLLDGRLGLGIGDVAGHGVTAAAAMGQMRMAFRAYMLEGLTPGRVLERLNVLLHDLRAGQMTTLVCACFDPETGAMTLARAGHPSPIIRSSAGEVRYVEGGLGPPLGVAPLTTYEETETDLLPGSTILLYTDGLVERRRESLDEGLQRLERAMAQAPEDLEGLCDEIIDRLLGAEGAPDDAAVLAVRREPLGQMLRLSFPAESRRIPSIRRHVGRWLRGNGFGGEDVSDILVACTEACTNAIQHAYGLKDGLVEVDASIHAGEATITVRDFGRWKAPGTPDREDASRGLPLMRGLMDAVDVVSGEWGTAVTMRRRARGVREDD